jgi:hypothetical protein
MTDPGPNSTPDPGPNSTPHSTPNTTPDAAIENAIALDTAASRTGRLGWLSIVAIVAFGLFYAYDLFEAISNVVGVTAQINDYNAARVKVDLAPVSTPWLVLILDLIVSPLVFTIAFLIGRRHTVFIKIIAFAIGLTVAAAASLTLIALA